MDFTTKRINKLKDRIRLNKMTLKRLEDDARRLRINMGKDMAELKRLEAVEAGKEEEG